MTNKRPRILWKRETSVERFTNGTTERVHSYVATINGYEYRIQRGWSRWEGDGWYFYAPNRAEYFTKTLGEARATAERIAAKPPTTPRKETNLNAPIQYPECQNN